MQPQGTFVSAMVEIYGGGGFVEQRADSASGSAVSPCSNSTSSTWYFADGYTVEGSKEAADHHQSVPVRRDRQHQRSDGTESRVPANLQSLLVKANSVLVVSQDLLAKRELVLAITVTSTRGRVVVGRAQEYLTSVGRAGFTMTLGAPSLGEQFYFADGEVGAQRASSGTASTTASTPRPWSTWRSSASTRRSGSSTPSRSPCRPARSCR